MSEWYSHTIEHYTRMLVQYATTWMNQKHDKQKKPDTHQQNKTH